jgi:hypothetical protein
MCAYLVAQAKYNTADKNGETRKERNARFGLTYTAVQPPDSGAHLLEWLSDAGRGRRFDSGYPCSLSLTDWQAWAELSDIIVRQEELAVLRNMDEAYINAVCKELSAQRKREQSSD